MATSGNSVTSNTFTLKANTTYLVFAFTHGGTDTTATFSSTFFGSPTFHNIGSGSLGYHGNNGGNHPVDAEFGRYLTGDVINETGTIKVTFSNTTSQAYLQVVELCGNDTSNPIAQSAYAISGADGTFSTPYTS